VSDIPAPLRFVIVTVPRAIIGVLILAGIAVNFANVIGRYVFLQPVIWADEAMVYIMVWTVFMGAVLVSFEGQHLKMDFFSIMLPSPWKQIINSIAAVSFLAVCVFVVPQTWTVLKLLWNFGQRSVVAEIPLVIPHFALLSGFVLMFLAVVLRFRSYMKGEFNGDIAGRFGGGPDDS
jgi:TRAP-type C4-dicarboxylate transport system permease small subunit